MQWKVWVDVLTRCVGVAGFRILSQELYSEDYTFFGHSPGGTWHGGDVAAVLWIVDRPWLLLCIMGGSIALVFGVLVGVGLRRALEKIEENGVLHGQWSNSVS